MSPARTFTQRFFFAVDTDGRPGIFDRGEVSDGRVKRVEFGSARWLCARYRHLREDAQPLSERVAEFCGARFLELHDAMRAWLAATGERRAA